jgi:hypothetical protein
VKRLDRAVVKPALERSEELVRQRAAVMPTRHIRDYDGAR